MNAIEFTGFTLLLWLMLHFTTRAFLQRRSEYQTRIDILACFFLSLATTLRLITIFYWHPPENFVDSDMAGYLSHALGFQNGVKDEFLFFTPPGFSLILAAFYSKAHHFLYFKCFQLICGVSAVTISWRAMVRWKGPVLGLIALALMSIHFPLIVFTGYFLVETVLSLKIAIVFYLLTRFKFPWTPLQAFSIGFAIAVGDWLKGTDAFLVPLIFLWYIYVFVKAKYPKKAVKRGALAFCLAVALVIGCFAGFSHFWINKTLVASTNGGLNFVEGKCPSKRNYDRDGAVFLSPLFTQINEVDTKRWSEPFTNGNYFYRAGLRCIEDNPVVLLTSTRYIYYLFLGNIMWPPSAWKGGDFLNSVWYWLYGILFLPAIVLASIALAFEWFKNKTKPIPAPLLISCSLFLLVVVFKSEARLRVPFDVVFLPLAVTGWDILLRTILAPQFHFNSRRFFKIQKKR